jgi:hypothetical protein
MKPRVKVRTYFPGYHDFMGPHGAGQLSPQAQALLVAVLSQYNGRNNGSMKLTASVLPRIWQSSDRRTKAKRELMDYAFIFEVKRGFQRAAHGMPTGARQNIASLFAVACYPLNDNVQHDPELVALFDQDEWRRRLKSKPPEGRRKRKTRKPSNAVGGIVGGEPAMPRKVLWREAMLYTALKDPAQCLGQHCRPESAMPPTCHLLRFFPSIRQVGQAGGVQ